MHENKLHLAAANPHTGYPLVKKFIEEESIHVDIPHSETGAPALAYATSSGSIETLMYLIQEAHASLDSTRCNFNLLMWPRLNKNQGVHKYIKNYINQLPPEKIEQFNDGTTTLHIAAWLGSLSRFKDGLKKNPENLNKADMRGITPLYYAAYKGHQHIVLYIIQHEMFIQENINNPAKFDNLNRGAAELFRDKVLRSGELVHSEDCFQNMIQLLDAVKMKQDADYLQLSCLNNDLAELYRMQTFLYKASKCYLQALDNIVKLSDFLQHEDLWSGIGKHIADSDPLFEYDCHEWGFDIVDIQRDGNCFFHAIVAQVRDKNLDGLSNLSHLALRYKTVEHMRQHWDSYEPFIPEENRSSYLSDMSKDGAWADHLAILALSRVFNLTLFTITLDDNAEPYPAAIKHSNPVAELYLLSLRNQHFVALDLNPNLKPAKDFRAVIDATEVDIAPINEEANDVPDLELCLLQRSIAYDSNDQDNEPMSPVSVLQGRSTSPFFAPRPNQVHREPQMFPVYSAQPDDEPSPDFLC